MPPCSMVTGQAAGKAETHPQDRLAKCQQILCSPPLDGSDTSICLSVGDQPLAPSTAVRTATLKDVRAVCAVFGSTLATAQDVDILVVIIAWQVRALNDFLPISVEIANPGCLASAAWDHGRPRLPRTRLGRPGRLHAKDPSFDPGGRGDRSGLKGPQSTLKAAIQISLLQPAGHCIGVVLVRAPPLGRVGSAPEPRVDLRNYRGAGGWRQAVEGPEVKLGSGGTDVTKPGDPGMIGLGYRSLRRSERPISRTRPLLRPS